MSKQKWYESPGQADATELRNKVARGEEEDPQRALNVFLSSRLELVTGEDIVIGEERHELHASGINEAGIDFDLIDARWN